MILFNDVFPDRPVSPGYVRSVGQKMTTLASLQDLVARPLKPTIFKFKFWVLLLINPSSQSHNCY